MNKHFKSQDDKKSRHDLRRESYALDKEAWLKENAEAIKARNKWIEENGLPLQSLRAKPKIIE